MNPTVDDELIAIVKNKSLNFEARSKGWAYILGLSVSNDGLNHMIDSRKYIPFLLSYVCQENEEEFVKMAFQSLINIAVEDRGTFEIVGSRKDICSHMLLSICDGESKNINYMCYLLANMTGKPEVIKMIIHIFVSSRGLLQNLMLVYTSSESSLRKDCDFLTLVFANISRLVAGRRFFIHREYFMTHILKCIKPSESESRRLGAALILRNCCLETGYHDKLLNNMGVLPVLLLPLMAPQEYEKGGEMGCIPAELQKQCLDEVKGRDESISVRRVLVEALTILCYSEFGWEYLKSNGTYYVVRDFHAAETDAVTKAAVEQLVSYFLVEEYQMPATLTSLCEEELLTKQLEADFTKELPDFHITQTE